MVAFHDRRCSSFQGVKFTVENEFSPRFCMPEFPCLPQENIKEQGVEYANRTPFPCVAAGGVGSHRARAHTRFASCLDVPPFRAFRRPNGKDICSCVTAALDAGGVPVGSRSWQHRMEGVSVRFIFVLHIVVVKVRCKVVVQERRPCRTSHRAVVI